MRSGLRASELKQLAPRACEIDFLGTADRGIGSRRRSSDCRRCCFVDAMSHHVMVV